LITTKGDFVKKFLLGLILTIGASAHASMLDVNGPLDHKLFDAEINEEKSYFETLGDMFNAGTQPDPEKLVDVLWAGRCFFAKNPNDPTNGAFIFREEVSDVGPIRHSTKKYEASVSYFPGKAPNYYDNMTLQDAMREGKAGFRKVSSTPSFLVIILPNGVTIELRLSGKYLVVEGRASTDSGPISKPGNVFARCYYFIPSYLNQ
jgi:hypothetical protein